MEVFYDGKVKLKRKKDGFDTFKHIFSARIRDDEEIPFYVVEPDPYNIHFEKGWNLTAERLILVGTAVLSSKDFIEKTMSEQMAYEKKKRVRQNGGD